MEPNNTILVVDDSLAMLGLATQVLREAGYTVLEASTAALCWETLKTSRVDLMVLDVRLPDGNGLDICRKIKADPALSHIVVLLISALQTTSEERASGLESGADGFITRPISNREFLARVQALLRLCEANEQLRSLSARLQSMLEDERTRISREIHDELGQLLTSLKMDLHWIESSLEEIHDPRINPILDKLVAASELADSTVQTVQRIASELRPGTLDRLGLPMALRCELDDFKQRTGIACHANVVEEDISIPPDVATAFFRIFQEALTNVARHARASAIEVSFRAEDRFYVLEIRDNGIGIEESEIAKSTSLGLLGMRERTTLLGGTVEIQRGETSGTTVTVRLPKAVLV